MCSEADPGLSYISVSMVPFSRRRSYKHFGKLLYLKLIIKHITTGKWVFLNLFYTTKSKGNGIQCIYIWKRLGKKDCFCNKSMRIRLGGWWVAGLSEMQISISELQNWDCRWESAEVGKFVLPMIRLPDFLSFQAFRAVSPFTNLARWDIDLICYWETREI